MVEFSPSSPDASNGGGAIEFTNGSTRTPSPTTVTPNPEDTNLTVSPRDSWLAYDLESLEGYSRMRSPGAGLDDTRRNIVLDDDGFISGEHGLPVLSLLLGSVRMPKTSSKMITLQERGERKFEVQPCIAYVFLSFFVINALLYAFSLLYCICIPFFFWC